MKKNRDGLKARLNKAEQQLTPEDREFRFVVIDHKGRETGEGMIVRPNQPIELITYTPKHKEEKS